MNISYFPIKWNCELNLGIWDIEAKKISYLGKYRKGSISFLRHYEIITKLLDIEDRIEQSAVLIEQSSLEDNNDNDEIHDLGWI